MPEEEKIVRLCNIGIIAHIDAGKTTTTECMLYLTGGGYKIGKVHEGTTTTDYDEQERKRGITIFSVAVTIYWKNKQINIIDTPGHLDFTGEVERSLRVLDGAIVILDGKEGVEAQTETVFQQANKYGIPRIIFVNKIDGVDRFEKFTKALEDIQQRLNAVPLVIQIPIGVGKNLKGVIDIIEQKAYYFQMGDKEENYQVQEIPKELIPQAKEVLQKLLEEIVEYDEKLFFKYSEGQKLTVDEIKSLVRKATLSGEKFPVLCGSAYKHVGVKLILDAVINYLPSPLDKPEIVVFSFLEKKAPIDTEKIKNKISELETSLNNLNLSLSKSSAENETIDKDLHVVKFEMEEKLIELKKQLKKSEPLKINCNNSSLNCLALAFKIIFNERNERLTFLRVYAGKVKTNSYLYNVNKRVKEKVGKGQLVRMHANKEEEIEEIGAGDIAVVKGLKYTITGDTLGEEKNPLLLETISFAKPFFTQAIEPAKESDKTRLQEALKILEVQDPSFNYRIDQKTGELLMEGMGKLHLEVAIEKLRGKEPNRIEISSKQPKIIYQETITKKLAKVESWYKRKTGGRGHDARIWISFEPNERGRGFEFIDEKKGDAMSNKDAVEVEKGLVEALSSGLLLNYPMVDVKATLHGGARHEVDTQEGDFKKAAILAFRGDGVEERKKRIYDLGVILLEPIMQVELSLPFEFENEVEGNLRSLGCEIKNREKKGVQVYFRGEAPLRTMFNYSETLLKITRGRGACSMNFLKYEEVSSYVMKNILEEEKIF
ncbi:MAG: translation elongation factor G [Mycoplasmataceae bacterium RC_NB112A]|nr:MAG: translation elongation factor G [Mycoplasmataceae bacterium RC_NB112A]KLL02262.1 MAG: translation elongation factor G [Mycoplasmataceae bacterium RC_NB112A]